MYNGAACNGMHAAILVRWRTSKWTFVADCASFVRNIWSWQMTDLVSTLLAFHGPRIIHGSRVGANSPVSLWHVWYIRWFGGTSVLSVLALLNSMSGFHCHCLCGDMNRPRVRVWHFRLNHTEASQISRSSTIYEKGMVLNDPDRSKTQKCQSANIHKFHSIFKKPWSMVIAILGYLKSQSEGSIKGINVDKTNV